MAKEVSVEIDPHAGFCSGVKRAIRTAEDALGEGPVCSLGAIVHNEEEVSRLEKKGILSTDRPGLQVLRDTRVLIRTHGEPPGTYRELEEMGLEVIDATCPVVARLQGTIRMAVQKAASQQVQVLIYGKKKHAEVIGLVGHSGGKARVIESKDDLSGVDFTRPAEIFSQTTMNPAGLLDIRQAMEESYRAKGIDPQSMLKVHDTICRQVARREESVKLFASRFDLLLFVSGKNSSNGAMLFNYAKESNQHACFISNPGEIKKEWIENATSVGISGATSTPPWLLEEVKRKIEQMVR